MDPVTIVVVAMAVLAFGIISRRVESSPLTAPMLFAIFGFLAGPFGLGYLDLQLNGPATHIVIELTLVLVLFTDASRIRLRQLREEFRLPARLLVIGLPLTIGLGLLLARPLFPAMSWAELALLAAILAPTDAALGQVVVSSARIPVRIRQALNVESGLNDGIAVPVVMALLAVAAVVSGDAASSAQSAETSGRGLGFAASQIGLGPLVGLAVAWPAGWLVQRAASSGSMSTVYEDFAGVAIAIASFGAAELVGGNGFISAFIAGLVIGNTTSTVCENMQEFAEDEGQLLTLIAFLIFGAVMLPPAVQQLDRSMALYIFLSLTVIRMVPVMIALLGTGLHRQSVAFLGWFGPRGLATVLFALLVAEAHAIPNHEAISCIASVAVAASILAHGMTAAPLVKSYGGWVARIRVAEPNRPECKPAPELPARCGIRE